MPCCSLSDLEEAMKRLELLIPPPVIMLLVGLLMWWMSIMFPGLAFDWLYGDAAAVIVGLLGMAVSLNAVLAFRRAGTTADPRRTTATRVLVSSGIYRYSRNPMYVGVLLMLLAWGIYLGNVLSILCAPIFIVYITRFQIIPEERMLHDKFGNEFLAYKNRVRRWL